MKKKHILIVGAGNVGMRVANLLKRRAIVSVLTRRPSLKRSFRRLGLRPLVGDLDRAITLRKLSRTTWDAIIHLAPPPAIGRHDRRTRHLIDAILPKQHPAIWVYISTSGVYGDCGGEWVTESRPVRPQTARAHRRIDAERQLYRRIRRTGQRAVVLRAPGIYDAAHLPLTRLRSGTPVLMHDEDVYTNHVHAEDLARMAVAAVRSRRSWRVYNACDDTRLPMADYFDAVADAFGLQRPPRVPRAVLSAQVSATVLSFMNESRRLDNRRIQRELRVDLLHRDVVAFVRSCALLGAPHEQCRTQH